MAGITRASMRDRWKRPEFCKLSVSAMIVHEYLLSNPHDTMEGIYRIDPAYMALDLRHWFTTDEVSASLDELEAEGIVKRDIDRDIVWTIDSAEYQVYTTAATTMIGIANRVAALSESPLVVEFWGRYPLLRAAADAAIEAAAKKAAEKAGRTASAPPIAASASLPKHSPITDRTVSEHSSSSSRDKEKREGEGEGAATPPRPIGDWGDDGVWMHSKEGPYLITAERVAEFKRLYNRIKVDLAISKFIGHYGPGHPKSKTHIEKDLNTWLAEDNGKQPKSSRPQVARIPEDFKDLF